MKKIGIISEVMGIIAMSLSGILTAAAEDLVILHTNDTHSAILPDKEGMGGVMQRKALIDSIRNAEENVVLVDAGDIVQGSLYYKFFNGDVEFPLMDMMGYDIMILGNHEFDNGLEEMAKYYRRLNAIPLSANYDFTSTEAEGIFRPSVVKEIGGKRIGFIGLNIDPSSIIASSNYEGMKFRPVVETGNDEASRLKNEENCDLVVAVTHIGAFRDNEKEIDYDLARGSRDIDIIIGGHSHTVIQPGNATAPEYPSIVANLDGRPVLVAQTGKYGRNLGYIRIDLDSLATSTPLDYDHRLIPVDGRFPDSELDEEMAEFIRPYTELLEEVDRKVIGRCDAEMKNSCRTGAFVNWTSDFASRYGRHIADSLRSVGHPVGNIDFAMMNTGGIRHSMPQGNITEGQILATFPFSNRIVLVEIKGEDFIDAMRIAALKGGEAISDELRVVTDDGGNLRRVLLNGEEMDPEKTYLFSTIDYIAWGNDDFLPLLNGRIVWTDEEEMSVRMLEYIRYLTSVGLPVEGDPRPRFVREVMLPGCEK